MPLIGETDVHVTLPICILEVAESQSDSDTK